MWIGTEGHTIQVYAEGRGPFRQLEAPFMRNASRSTVQPELSKRCYLGVIHCSLGEPRFPLDLTITLPDNYRNSRLQLLVHRRQQVTSPNISEFRPDVEQMRALSISSPNLQPTEEHTAAL